MARLKVVATIEGDSDEIRPLIKDVFPIWRALVNDRMDVVKANTGRNVRITKVETKVTLQEIRTSWLCYPKQDFTFSVSGFPDPEREDDFGYEHVLMPIEAALEAALRKIITDKDPTKDPEMYLQSKPRPGR